MHHDVLIAAVLRGEDGFDLESLYANIGGYRLQKYNHTKSVEDLKAVFCTLSGSCCELAQMRNPSWHVW